MAVDCVNSSQIAFLSGGYYGAPRPATVEVVKRAVGAGVIDQAQADRMVSGQTTCDEFQALSKQTWDLIGMRHPQGKPMDDAFKEPVEAAIELTKQIEPQEKDLFNARDWFMAHP